MDIMYIHVVIIVASTVFVFIIDVYNYGVVTTAMK